jgi:hypothetical protein
MTSSHCLSSEGKIIVKMKGFQVLLGAIPFGFACWMHPQNGL